MAMRCFLVLGLLVVLQFQAAAGQRRAYFMDNNPAGNNIVSLKIDLKTGLLSSPVLTPTGGKGELGLKLPAGTKAGPDTLFSQDCIVVDGNYLFVVNPGSNTLSFFYIPETDPSYPILVGEPADTLGEFPVSVAYSSKLGIACVINSGAQAGVTCFCVTRQGLIPLDTSPRSIAAHYNQTTPPVGPPSTASDILFNPSSTALFAIIKGPEPNPTPGFFYVWPVVEGKVSINPVISSPAGITLNFGSVFLGGDDRLFVTDAAGVTAIVDVSSSFEVTVEEITAIPGGPAGAPCWAEYSPKFKSVYVESVQFDNITVVDPKSGAIKGYVQFPATASLPGSFDAAIDRDKLYVLAGEPAVLVFELDIDVEKIKLVQIIDLTSLGSRMAWQGMAIYHG